jgi:hypothetical protein
MFPDPDAGFDMMVLRRIFSEFDRFRTFPRVDLPIELLQVGGGLPESFRWNHSE